MRSKIEVTTVYKFDELSPDQQDKAIEKLWDINIDFGDWYESVYEDAETIGLKITGFDLDRHQISGHMTKDAETVACNIIEEHGKVCETYQDAQKYLEELTTARNIHEAADMDGEEFDSSELDSEFEHTLLEDYRVMLRKDYEYLTGRESIIETIEANDYEFTAEGELI
jgi:hypothetical protein